MYIDSLDKIPQIALAFSTTIFAVDPDIDLDLKPLISLSLDIDTVSQIEDIRELIQLTKNKQTKELFLVIRHAELLSEKSSNVLLKTIEEPGNHIHILFLTKKPLQLLQTIRSRSMLFYYRIPNTLTAPPRVSTEILDYAKKLLVSDKYTLIQLAEDLSKKKLKKSTTESDKTFILNIIETSIELAYKSYYKTNNKLFLKKIIGLDQAYQNISKNGNKKLQLIANLI